MLWGGWGERKRERAGNDAGADLRRREQFLKSSLSLRLDSLDRSSWILL